jgi:hypothetical protein
MRSLQPYHYDRDIMVVGQCCPDDNEDVVSTAIVGHRSTSFEHETIDAVGVSTFHAARVGPLMTRFSLALFEVHVC